MIQSKFENIDIELVAAALEELNLPLSTQRFRPRAKRTETPALTRARILLEGIQHILAAHLANYVVRSFIAASRSTRPLG